MTPATVPTGSAEARVVVPAADMARVIDRMAHQILEKHSGSSGVVLLGIPTRGVTLARRLSERMTAFEGASADAGSVPWGSLDVTLYRDDLRMRGPRALEQTRLPPEGVDDRIVVLVDDVLFSGRTVRAALDALGDLGRPSAVQLAVLVDRGHRQLPIRADYVGKNIPTSTGQAVHVRLEEDDGHDAVLVGPADAGRSVAQEVAR